MKVGLILSAIIVVVFGIIFFLATSAGAGDPPKVTRDGALLEAYVLAENLPVLSVPTEPSADANERYDLLMEIWGRYDNRQTTRELAYSTKEELADLMIDAANAGRVRAPLLSRHATARPGLDADFARSVTGLVQALAGHAEATHADGDTQRADELARALLSFAVRLHRHGQTLTARMYGLMLIENAGMTLAKVHAGDAAMMQKLAAYNDAMVKVRKPWEEKQKVVLAGKPHVGDTLNIALNDKDPTWRATATMTLGRLKFSPGSKGNLKAIEAAIEKLKGDDNPRVAEAAQAAEAMTREDIQKM